MLTVWENPGKNAIWRELGQGRKRKPRAGEGGEQREGWLVSETERVQETQGLALTEHTASTVTGQSRHELAALSSEENWTCFIF